MKIAVIQRVLNNVKYCYVTKHKTHLVFFLYINNSLYNKNLNIIHLLNKYFKSIPKMDLRWVVSYYRHVLHIDIGKYLKKSVDLTAAVFIFKTSECFHN